MNGLSLTIADIPLDFRWRRKSRFLDLLQKRYVPFTHPKSSEPILFNVSTRKRYGRLPSDAELSLKTSLLHLRRSDFSAVYDPAARRGELEVAENPYSFDSFLRVFLSWLLPRCGGLMVHAASAVQQGIGYLFPALSEGGKSTLTRMTAPAEPLTDELSLLRWDGGAYRLHGSPFWGELASKGRPVSAAVGGIYFLHKGPEVQVRSVAKPEAAHRLLGTIMSFDKTTSGVELLWGRVEHLLTAVDSHELTFSKTAPFWGAVQARELAGAR